MQCFTYSWSFFSIGPWPSDSTPPYLSYPLCPAWTLLFGALLYCCWDCPVCYFCHETLLLFELFHQAHLLNIPFVDKVPRWQQLRLPQAWGPTVHHLCKASDLKCTLQQNLFYLYELCTVLDTSRMLSSMKAGPKIAEKEDLDSKNMG